MQIKAGFTLTPQSSSCKPGKQLDAKALAESAYNQTAAMIEGPAEGPWALPDELALMQLSSHATLEISVVDTVFKAACELDVAATLANAGTTVDSMIKLLSSGAATDPCAEASAPTTKTLDNLFQQALASAESVDSEEKVVASPRLTAAEVNLTKARLVLTFVKKNDSEPMGAAHLEKIREIVAKELGT